MAPDNQIGLEAIFENEDFQNGVEAYNRTIRSADSETQDISSSMSDAWSSLSEEQQRSFEELANSVGLSVEEARQRVDDALNGIDEDFTTLGEDAPGATEPVKDSVEEIGDVTEETADRTEESTSRMAAVWDGLASVGQAAFAVIAAAIAAMTVELYAAVTAAFDAEDAMARVNFIVAKVADRTGVTTDEVGALADSLSKVLPIDDEVIAQAIAMGLTFDGVNKDNIQPLIGAAADLAAFTGKDLPGTMRELALAISDPDRAMRLLKDANITLSDSEVKTLKGFKDVGDTAGATTFLLNELKNKGIIGLGEAMGDTAKGKLTIMETAIGNLQEALGTGLTDALKDVFETVTNFANSPATIQFFTNLGQTIGSLAKYFIIVVQDGDTLNDFLVHLPEGIRPVVKAVGEFVNVLIEGVPKAFQWLKDNQPIIIGILAAIGAALVVFAAGAAATAITTAASFAPVIAIFAVIGAAVALFVKAWQEDWGGVQGKVAKAWKQIKPVFDQLQTWLKDNLPKALKTLSEFWENILLPAIKATIGWIVDNVLPILVELVQWLGTNVPKAIQATSDFFTKTLLPAIKAVGDWITTVLIPTLQSMRDWFETYIVNGIKTLVATIQGFLTPALAALASLWTSVLLPAITAVWAFINNNLMPIFSALANLLDAVVGLAIRVLAGLWQNFLLPAISAVWTFIKNNLMPIFNSVSDTMGGALATAIRVVSDLWENTLQPAIQKVWDKLKPFADFLSNVLKKAFDGIRSAVQYVVDLINDLADSINNLNLPDWLTPGSPTPFEMGLRGINEQLEKLARASIPAIKQQMEILGTVRDVPGINGSTAAASISNSSQSTRNYLYGANFNLPGATGLIETLQGL